MNNRTDDNKRSDKMLKTSAILAVLTALPQLLCLVGDNKKISNTLSLLSAALTVYYLHHVGERRRPGSNLVANTTASIQTVLLKNPLNADKTRAKNAIRNVINGGDVVFDQMVAAVNEQANGDSEPGNALRRR